MRYENLPGVTSEASAKVSVLGFGCAALMGSVGRKDSLAALAAAEAAGITFFDTARSYGYGESEVLLGEFLRGRRQSVVLCTKFGILPSTKQGWKRKVKPLAQAAIKRFPGLRTYVRRHAVGQNVGGQFSVDLLQASLERSLRALRTDYVDMLLLHGATLDVLDRDDVLGLLQRAVEQGKCRVAGISGEQPVILETLRRRPAMLTTAQLAVNRTNLGILDLTRQANANNLFMVANHPFGGPAGVAGTFSSLEALARDEALPEDLRRKLLEKDSQLIPEVILNVILRDTGICSVIPTMMKKAHLQSNVKAVEGCRFSSEEIARLRNALAQQRLDTLPA